MTNRKTAAIVLAAGKGSRMESAQPKVMHEIAGRPLIQLLMATLDDMNLERLAVVIGGDMEEVAEAVAPRRTVIQAQRLGTGHAVMAAREVMEGFDGDVLILYGDTPLISSRTLRRMMDALHAPLHVDGSVPAVVVLGFRPADPGVYGRLIMGTGDSLKAIVEAGDATPGQLAVDLCNSGVMAVDGAVLFGLLGSIENNNAKGEFYLTDIVSMARSDSLTCAVVEGPAWELIGINSRAELAEAEAIVQGWLRARVMAGGATLIDPASVFLCHDTRIGRDVVIGPNVFFGPGVVVGNGVVIHPYCHIEGARIAAGASVGPFARLRPGTTLAEDARVGNFVEVKNASLESGAKANHLSYIGDARIGAGANIGAGTITCNYDGTEKHHTDIGAGAFIGSNTALVAPVKIGDGAVIGAGSTIDKDVPDHALALTRAERKEIKGWAKRRRAKPKGKSK